MAKTTRRRPTRTTVPSGYLDTGEPVRPAQRQFIDDLLGQRFVPEDFSEQELLDRYNTNRIDKHGASTLIDALKALPRVYRGGRAAGRTADLPEVRAGRYCLYGAHGAPEFYRVRHGEGQFDGWTYLDIQASDEFHPITSVGRARRVLEEINTDPKRAAVRYSHLLGKCFNCGRSLTNRVSRKVGCGAICAEQTGWYDEYTIALLEEAAQREGTNHHEQHVRRQSPRRSGRSAGDSRSGQ
jgi:hypothetical protein